MRKNNQYYVRKTHRYLGIVIGVQLLLWTLGGFYFSWSDIDEIHGDHLVHRDANLKIDTAMISPGSIGILTLEPTKVSEVKLVEVLGEPYYLITYSIQDKRSPVVALYHAYTGKKREEISMDEAKQIAIDHFIPESKIESVELIAEKDINDHHEYRGSPLPAWAVTFDHPSKSTLYIPTVTGQMLRIRYNKWRTFDFLWMLHTMDYQSRDDFGNFLIRSFSVLAILTILSGMSLFILSSPKRIRDRKKS